MLSCFLQIVGPNVVSIQPEGELVRQQLGRMLSSAEFSQSDRMSRFLRFIVTQTLAGRGDTLKESLIGVHVFDREPSYDPKADPVVRSEARRLRSKLLEYNTNHPEDPLWIELPKGGYVPEFHRRDRRASADRPEPQPIALQPRPRRSFLRRNATWIGACAAVALLALITGWVLSRRATPPYTALDARPFTTSNGNAGAPSFSPDGKTLAYSWDGPDQGRTHIWVQNAESATPRQLTNSEFGDYRPVWSPDGRRIAFLRLVDGSHAAICTAEVAGGGEQIHTVVMSPLSTRGRVDWSPDGKYLATSERLSPESPSVIILISLEGAAKRQLTNPPPASRGDTDAAFSPDGRLIAFRRTVSTGIEDLYTVPVAEGAGAPVKRVTFDDRGIYGHAWAPDGNSIIAASTRVAGTHSLWRFSFSGGAPSRLTGAGIDAVNPAVSRSGGKLAFESLVNDSNIWELDLGSGAAAKRIIDSTMLDTSPQYSPDGRWIAFRSNRSGSDEVWITEASGAHPRQVTHFNGPLSGSPRWSPDGSLLAVESRLGQNADVYLVSPDGAQIRRFTTEPSRDILPSWSRDGKFIYFGSDRSGRYEVWKQPVAAGAAWQVTRNGGVAAFESADGRELYYAKSTPLNGVFRVPVSSREADSPETPLLPQIDSAMWGNWAAGRRGIWYLEMVQESRPSVAAIMFFDFSTKTSREIGRTTAVPAIGDSGLAVSPDERKLLYAQVDRAGSNIFIADTFR
jgi:Tol biopolymer transport system component